MTDSTPGQSPTSAPDLEAKYVHQAYRASAPHFRHRKYKMRSKVKAFLNALSPGSLVADIGCGNGRYLKVNERISVIGVDVCMELLKQTDVSGTLCDVVAANNISLPFRSSCFDAVLSINVIHHFATRERRLQSLAELVRLLKPGGKLLVYVWALEQNHRGFNSQDIMVPWRNPSLDEDSCGDSTDGCDSDSFVVDNQPEVINNVCSSVAPGDSTKSDVKSSLFLRLGGMFSRNHVEAKSVQSPVAKVGFVQSVRDAFGSVMAFSPKLPRRLKSIFGNDTIETVAEVFATRLAKSLMAESLQLLYEVEIVNSQLGVVDGGRKSVSPERKDHQQLKAFRYYHVFRKGELEEIIGELDQLHIHKSFYDRANWCVSAIKVSPQQPVVLS